MKKILKKLFAISVIFSLTMPSNFVNAYNKNELNIKKEQVNDLKSNLNETKVQKQLLELSKENLNKELTNNKNQLDKITKNLNIQKNKSQNLKNNINDNIGQINRLNTELNVVLQKVNKTKNEISNVNKDILETKKEIKENKSDLRQTIRYLQKTSNLSTIIKYLEHSKSLNGFIQQLNAVTQVNTFHKKIIDKAIKQNNKLKDQQESLNSLKNELLENTNTIVNAQDVINSKTDILKNNLDLTAKLESNLTKLNQDKVNANEVTKTKIAQTEQKYNNVVSKEQQTSQEIEKKQYQVDVYARELTSQERQKIQDQINSQASKPKHQNNVFSSPKTYTPKVQTTSYNQSRPQVQPTLSTGWIFPKTCRNLTETYGEYHPELYGSYDGGYHHAVDYACGFGTQIYAPTWGKIVEVIYSPYGYGTHIVFATNYHSHNYKLVIGHFSSVNVYPGQSVKPGQVLGYEGSTGNSTGPHTHFELWQDGYHMDPRVLWN